MTVWRDSQPLVLASQSRARQMLLANAGIAFEARPADIDERAIQKDSGLAAPGKIAALLAREKALAVSRQKNQQFVIGADQTLALDGHIFNKPAGRSQAHAQLSQLAGHTKEIDATLGSINVLAKQLAAQRPLIGRALVRLSPGIKALSADTAGFTRLVTHLSRLGRTATHVLGQVQTTLVTDIKGLSPTLDTLVELRSGLRPVLNGLRNFAVRLDRAIPGDSLNLRGSLVVK